MKSVSRRFVLLSCSALPALPAVNATAKADEGHRLDLLKVLARNVWTWRVLRGYTQDQLARKCGYTHERMSQIEQASLPATVGDLFKLAEHLQCAASELLNP